MSSLQLGLLIISGRPIGECTRHTSRSQTTGWCSEVMIELFQMLTIYRFAGGPIKNKLFALISVFRRTPSKLNNTLWQCLSIFLTPQKRLTLSRVDTTRLIEQSDEQNHTRIGLSWTDQSRIHIVQNFKTKSIVFPKKKKRENLNFGHRALERPNSECKLKSHWCCACLLHLHSNQLRGRRS